MKIISDNKKCYVTQFDGLFDVLDFIGWEENKEQYLNHSSGSTGSYAVESKATATFEEALQLAVDGWEVGTSAILDKVSQVSSLAHDYTTSYRMDVTGDFFDVGLVVTGEPECWFHPEPEPSKRIISICVNLAASCSVSTEQIQNRGAAVVSLIDKLQEDPANVVELTLVSGWRDCAPFKTCFDYINVGMSPLPLNDISFMIAHPSMLRRMLFAVSEKRNSWGDMGCYGYPEDTPAEDQKRYNVYLGRSYSENGIRAFDTIGGAARWVDETIERLNQRD